MPDHNEVFDVVVVGGGPAGLRAAEVAAQEGARVVVVEQGRTPGRKFLLAGRSGLNLTHSEPVGQFIHRYGPDHDRLVAAINGFSPTDIQEWAAGLGEPCQVGSSGRVFPKSWRAAPLLRGWLRRLDALGVIIRTQTKWTGFVDHGPSITTDRGTISARSCILACGGASWPRTGSNGMWTSVVESKGVPTLHFGPANAGVRVNWSAHVLRHAGQPLKDIVLSHPDGTQSRGDLVIVERGIQGTPAYTLASLIHRTQPEHLIIDVRPDINEEDLADRLGRRRPGESTANLLRRVLHLSPAMVTVLNEGQRLPNHVGALAHHLKFLPLRVNGVDPIERAISTTGGIPWTELDTSLQLRACPGVFAAGEMIAWDAPTGGYLLQACLSTGDLTGRHAAEFVRTLRKPHQSAVVPPLASQ